MPALVSPKSGRGKGNRKGGADAGLCSTRHPRRAPVGEGEIGADVVPALVEARPRTPPGEEGGAPEGEGKGGADMEPWLSRHPGGGGLPPEGVGGGP